MSASGREQEADKPRPAAAAATAVVGPLREHFEGIQRARILSAMLEVCAELGGTNVTVAEVVRRAGLSRRTFYELFDGCEDCLLAALDFTIDKVSERVGAAYGAPGDWAGRIRASLVALLEFLEEESAMGSVLVLDSFAAAPGIRERRVRLLALLTPALDAGRVAGEEEQEPPALIAEWVAGAVLFVLHSRMSESREEPLIQLVNPLMSMIVLPYLGQDASRAELRRPVVKSRRRPKVSSDPLRDIGIRLTYRTVRALVAIDAQPGSSNRQVGRAAGIEDPGQISKLLARLERLGLIVNPDKNIKGVPNHWILTDAGRSVRDLALTQTATG